LAAKVRRVVSINPGHSGVGPAAQEGTTANTSLPPMSMVITLTSSLGRRSWLRASSSVMAFGELIADQGRAGGAAHRQVVQGQLAAARSVRGPAGQLLTVAADDGLSGVPRFRTLAP
jgi:hypothetical protein